MGLYSGGRGAYEMWGLTFRRAYYWNFMVQQQFQTPKVFKSDALFKFFNLLFTNNRYMKNTFLPCYPV